MASSPASIHSSATALAAAIRGGDLSPVELMRATLARINELDGVHHAFVNVEGEHALALAAEREREARAGRLRGPLHGIPIAVKDLVDVAGWPTLCGSRVRGGHLASADAPIVERLRAAGALVVGKTETHEFAYGPICPVTHNAHDPGRISGGSSGGSAVAVAHGMAALAIGTDTGGSIRIPSALNGVVGLKPTYGRVPKAGVAPLSWSLDHAGPIARTVGDAALMLGVMAGRDRSDVTSARDPVDDYGADLARGGGGLRAGVPTNYFAEHLAPDVRAAYEAAVRAVGELGVTCVDVHVPEVEWAAEAFFSILLSEASAFHQPQLRALAGEYGDDVRHWLELGELELGTHYVNGQRVRTRIKEGFRRCFEDNGLDVLLCPTVPIVASPVGAQTVRFADGAERPIMAALLDLCHPFNLSGQPVLTVPCGFGADGLPVGLAIAGRPFDERTVLRLGAGYERATPALRAAPATAAPVR